LARIATAAALGLAALMCAAPVRADVVDDEPAAVSPSEGMFELYARGPNGDLLGRLLGPAGWTDWSSLRGTLSSGPRVMLRDASTLDVFARSAGNTVAHRARINGSWTAWEDLGNPTTGGVLSAPDAAVRRGTGGIIDVVARAADNTVAFRSWVPSTGWGAWGNVGGATLVAPAVVSYRTGWVHVFARATDNSIQATSWDPAAGAWSAWSSIGGVGTSAPSVVSDGDNRIDVFVRGADAGVQRRSWTSAGWGSWSEVDPTPLSSGPTAVVLGLGRIALFARRGQEIVTGTLSDGAWSGWTTVSVPPPPPPIPPPTSCGHSAALTRDSLRGERRRTIGFGHAATVTGQALGPDRTPVPGALLYILDVRADQVVGRAVAGQDGRFRFRVPPGPSRTLRAGFKWASEGFFACGMSLSLKVRAGVRLSALRHVRSRGLIALSGRLLGGYIPPRGKVVELQGWANGAWRLFRSVRTSKAGRYHTRYRVRTGVRGILRIRARVRRERGYPYTLGYSRVVRVRVG
jgi:hypothetical protein